MRLQGWTSFIRTTTTTTTAGFLYAVSRQQAALGRSHTHVRPLSRSAANMAEEAKKLAAYAAVDNHVQVRLWTIHTFPLNKKYLREHMCYISHALAAE